MSVNFPSTVGVNFSNTFQSVPVLVSDAATQIAAMGTKMVKTYNYTQTDFIEKAKAAGLKVVLGFQMINWKVYLMIQQVHLAQL